MRVGILAIQTLYSLSNASFNLLSIDKLTLLYGLYRGGFVPRYGVVYFGQRKNLVLLDCQHQSRDSMTYTDILTHLSLQDTEWSQNGSFFIDYFVADDFPAFVDHPQKVSLYYSN